MFTYVYCFCIASPRSFLEFSTSAPGPKLSPKSTSAMKYKKGTMKQDQSCQCYLKLVWRHHFGYQEASE